MLEQKVVVGLTVAVPFVCNRPGVGCWLDFPILGGCCFSKAQISVWGNSTVQSGEFPGLGSWKDLLSRAKNSSWIFYYRSLASVIRHHGSTFFFEFSKENPISLPRLQDEICFSSLCQREHPRGLCFSCKRLSWLFFFFFFPNTHTTAQKTAANCLTPRLLELGACGGKWMTPHVICVSQEEESLVEWLGNRLVRADLDKRSNLDLQKEVKSVLACAGMIMI